MRTSELIENLSADAKPVSRHAVAWRFAAGIGGGALVSALGMWLWLGIRPDLLGAMSTAGYWIKFFYTLALAMTGYWATARLARPGAGMRLPAWGIALAAVLIAAIATAQWLATPPAQRMAAVMGHSARVCAWNIIILSSPILVGTFFSLRRLAPTRLALAGAVAGLAAGALGAWIYAFHCDESSAPFVAIFYTLGIGGISAAGALFGRQWLRW